MGRLPSLREKRFQRILLIKLSAIGDIVHTLPVLSKLRARYPSAQIDWLIKADNADLIRSHPALSNVLLFDPPGGACSGRLRSVVGAWLKTLHAVWRSRYDLVIDLHGQLRSGLLTLASAAPIRLGFGRPVRPTPADLSRWPTHGSRHYGWRGARDAAWLAYSHRIPVRTAEVHAVDRNLWLVPVLGLDDGPPDFSLHLPAEADAGAARLLSEKGLLGRRFAVLAPGTVWQTKHWLTEGFALVGRHLLRKGMAVALMGAPRDRTRCQEVAAACPGAHDLSGRTTLTEFAALLGRAAVCVTNDSGPMHLATALGTPVVSVFGPTDPVKAGPYGRPQAVLRAGLPCSPCHLRSLRGCPYHHACMSEVSAAMVIERLEEVLAGSRSCSAA